MGSELWGVDSAAEDLGVVYNVGQRLVWATLSMVYTAGCCIMRRLGGGLAAKISRSGAQVAPQVAEYSYRWSEIEQLGASIKSSVMSGLILTSYPSNVKLAIAGVDKTTIWPGDRWFWVSNMIFDIMLHMKAMNWQK